MEQCLCALRWPAGNALISTGVVDVLRDGPSRQNGENGMEALVVHRLRVVLAQDLSICSNLQCQMLARYPGSAETWVDIDVLPRGTSLRSCR